MAKKSTSHQVVTVAVVAIVSILGIVMFMGNQTATGEYHRWFGGGGGGWSAPSWSPPTCIDGDGSNAYTPGISDRCIDVDTVSEYYCSGGSGISTYIDCAGGTVCLTNLQGMGYCGTPVAVPKNSTA